MMTYSAPASLIIARADFAGERAFAFPEHVLRRHRDVAVARGLARGVHRGKRGRDDDGDVVDVLDEPAQLFDVDRRLVNGLEHLPVAGDEGYSHNLAASAVALLPDSF